MNPFVQEDGMGNMYDEDSEKFTETKIEVNEANYPLRDVTKFDQYSDLKPPEKIQQDKKELPEDKPLNLNKIENGKTTYRKYKEEDIEKFFFLVNEKGMSIRGAAAVIKVPSSTAYNWHKKGLKCLENDEDIGKSESRATVKSGKPATFNDTHKEYLVSLIDEKPSIALDEMMEDLTSQFTDMRISKSFLYEFVTKKCNISLKRAHLHSMERNSPQKIEERYQWVKHWEKTDLDFESNCVFIDEATFHINMKRSMTWSRKGERAVVTPTTRGKTTTIIGAISPYGVVNIKVKSPKIAAPSRKQKAAADGSSIIEKGKGEIVTGHYFNFVSMTLDIMDKHELFKGHYLVMDNAPIHKHTDIKAYIEGRGYGCVYLPSYSPELNPIEQFWSVCKSKLKRETLLEEETLTSRLRVACNNVLISDLRGFCRYSVTKFSDCLEKRPI
ncbi:hypothetical protein G6F56_001477 [Rhizopus delemar]|nr:hypothetical protein G6F56_001477 [Rhizopus delemar]